jgi:hypothetical protein
LVLADGDLAQGVFDQLLAGAGVVVHHLLALADLGRLDLGLEVLAPVGKVQGEQRQVAALVAPLVHLLAGDGIARGAVPDVDGVRHALPLRRGAAGEALEQVQLRVAVSPGLGGFALAPLLRRGGQVRRFLVGDGGGGV